MRLRGRQQSRLGRRPIPLPSETPFPRTDTCHNRAWRPAQTNPRGPLPYSARSGLSVFSVISPDSSGIVPIKERESGRYST